LNLIYNEIINNGLGSLPKSYRPECKSVSMPCFKYNLQFKIDSVNYDLVYLTDCSYFPIFGYFKNRKDKQIFKTIQFINHIVANKINVSRLPKSNLIFK
jgi:hypothetical protein